MLRYYYNIAEIAIVMKPVEECKVISNYHILIPDDVTRITNIRNASSVDSIILILHDLSLM